MSQKIVITLFFLFATFVSLPPALRAEQPVTLNLDPASISISAFYNGTDVKVSGEAPADTELLIRLTGTRHDVTLKKKGKVGGVLWMNVGEVTFENVPSVYLLYTSKGLGEIATSENSNKWDSMGLGFDALKQDMKVLPTTNDKEVVFKEFMKLKKHEDLYKLEPDAVQFTGPTGAMKPYTATIHVPPRLKPGTYQVDLIAVKGDKIIEGSSQQLKLTQIGFPAFLSSMAFDRSLLYGVMAVVIAIFAGLGTSLIFRSKGGAH
ncbi:MAG: TIGR02186 family protein [Proteobacteria bacterium]|nr:TIGR02186 family protein [Pseudomonadota bacterium]MBU4295763.1 TIGR02186 family protein [Pseudomonadota bacterium]MCG2749070.1 TIGR02186 family protein [Desulfobulbaceae bacterium]